MSNKQLNQIEGFCRRLETALGQPGPQNREVVEEVFSDPHLAILPRLADFRLNVNHVILQVDELSPFGCLARFCSSPSSPVRSPAKRARAKYGTNAPIDFDFRNQ